MLSKTLVPDEFLDSRYRKHRNIASYADALLFVLERLDIISDEVSQKVSWDYLVKKSDRLKKYLPVPFSLICYRSEVYPGAISSKLPSDWFDYRSEMGG